MILERGVVFYNEVRVMLQACPTSKGYKVPVMCPDINAISYCIQDVILVLVLANLVFQCLPEPERPSFWVDVVVVGHHISNEQANTRFLAPVAVL